jgi:hypothetical protein
VLVAGDKRPAPIPVMVEATGSKRPAPIPVMVEDINLENSAFEGKFSVSTGVRKSDLSSELPQINDLFCLSSTVCRVQQLRLSCLKVQKLLIFTLPVEVKVRWVFVFCER